MLRSFEEYRLLIRFFAGTKKKGPHPLAMRSLASKDESTSFVKGDKSFKGAQKSGGPNYLSGL